MYHRYEQVEEGGGEDDAIASSSAPRGGPVTSGYPSPLVWSDCGENMKCSNLEFCFDGVKYGKFISVVSSGQET